MNLPHVFGIWDTPRSHENIERGRHAILRQKPTRKRVIGKREYCALRVRARWGTLHLAQVRFLPAPHAPPDLLYLPLPD